MKPDKFYFKGVKVTCCDLDGSVRTAFDKLKKGEGPAYICVTDTGNIVNAYRNSPALRNAINSSFLSLPDGRPLSLFADAKGIKGIGRVAGPDFMEEVFRRSAGMDVKHFFLGDTQEVLNRLKDKAEKQYGIIVCGMLSPDLGSQTDGTDENIVNGINQSGADFIWVALGGGKQEIWMMNNYMKLDRGIMTGVGAAFRFYIGDIRRAPVFFRKIGMEWFFRLIQQPGKMAGRYLSTLPFFIIYAVPEFFKSKSKLTQDL